MKHIDKTKAILLLLLFLLTILPGCEYDGPNSIWEEAQKQKDIIPVITKILPEDAGAASEIIIVGENFSPTPAGNIVFFDNFKAVVRSASTTEIVVFRPAAIGSAITIKVSVQGAIALATYSPYKLEAVTSPFGVFLDTDAILALAMDKDENAYLSMKDKSVIKLTPEGKRDESYRATASNFTTDMKMGSGGYLYFLRKQDQVYRIPPTGGDVERYVKFKNGEKAKFFDFDENGNIYAGGEQTGLLLLRPDKTNENLGHYKELEINSVRVFNGYVYVGAMGDSVLGGAAGIWRNQILSATGAVGDKELVLDRTRTGDYASSDVNAITFSLDGDLYIGTNNPSPMLVVKSDGSIAPFFYGLMQPSIDLFVWGNGNFLYAIKNRRTDKSDGGELLRINMGKLSAPYYGR